MLTSKRVLIVGVGLTGRSFIAAATRLGAHITLCDTFSAKAESVAAEYSVQWVEYDAVNARDYDLILTGPGIKPDTEFFHQGIPVWGDFELATRINDAQLWGPRKQFLLISGTNGKTTTTMMTHAILDAAGLHSVSCGNIGFPVLEAMASDADFVVAEISSFQLQYAPSVRPHAGLLLNVAPDHIDWHGSFEAYTGAKSRVLQGDHAIICLDDPVAKNLSSQGELTGITLGEPSRRGTIGIVGDAIVDNAFAEKGIVMPVAGVNLATPAGMTDALGAIALARSVGVSYNAIDQALGAFQLGEHRGEFINQQGPVRFSDNSKATNPHAALSAVSDVRSVYPHDAIIVIAGGQLKGADIVPLTRQWAREIAALIVFGADSEHFIESFSQHAPLIPIIWLHSSNYSYRSNAIDIQVTSVVVPDFAPDVVMHQAVQAAASFAQSIAPQTATIVLAPAGASLDMFSGYAHRGGSFQRAVQTVLSGT